MKKYTFKISFSIPGHAPISILDDNPEIVINNAERFLKNVKKIKGLNRKYKKYYKSTIINPESGKEDLFDCAANPALYINNKQISFITRVKR